MKGKCFVLLSSVFPSGTYLGKCTGVPGIPYLSPEGTAISVVLCSLSSRSQEFTLLLHQFVFNACLIKVQLYYIQILEISVEILSSALTALVENTSVDCL